MFSGVTPLTDIDLRRGAGEADAMWPATEMAEIAEHRATERGFIHQLTHLRYPGAGHLCGGVPGTPGCHREPPPPDRPGVQLRRQPVGQCPRAR
jgi:hypothetical protein